MEEEWGWPGALGAGILVVIFGALAISASGGWRWFTGTEGAIWAAWAQSGSALLAIVAALWIALSGVRQKKREDADRASLVAARLSGLIENVLALLKDAEANIEFVSTTTSDQISTLAVAMRAAKSALAKIRIEDLCSLVSLPNHAGHRLARAVALLEGLAEDIEGIENWTAYMSGQEDNAIVALIGRFTRSVELLKVSQSALATAANRGAPHPSSEELYGPLGFDDC
jgi:metal-dependent amidase/aminoacylase/carboxypeptidase family protein